MFILACIASAVVACDDHQLTGPGGPPAPPILFSQGSPDVPVQGCATWKITLTGGTGITVASVSKPSCGPILPRLDAPATYDPTTKTISLTIADSNTWTRQVVAPARDYVWNDSILITTPSGLKNGTTGIYLRLIGMDSTIGATAATFKNARFWKYDTLLAPHGQSQVLLPGRKSRQRSVQIQVVSGSPTVFTVLVRSQAENANPVPATVPDSEPAWLSADSARLHFGEFFHGFTSKYALAVEFKAGVSQKLKQAAVDSVGGVVIGGYSILSIYLVQVPTDSTGTLLNAAAGKLLTLTQVKTAEPYTVAGDGPDYRRPSDGTNWGASNWRISRDSVHGENWAEQVINAPLAWGCDTGSATTAVAVVDQMLYRAPDLSPNLNTGLSRGLGAEKDNASLNIAHGTAVASIMAAVGDNQKGITGVMWRADLRVYDY